MREIRTLRVKWRGLETESRTTLPGHEGGNPGYRQGESCGLPRQSSTLPAGPGKSIDFQDPALQNKYYRTNIIFIFSSLHGVFN